MAFPQTLYLFSEVRGNVLLDGKPVQGAQVEQEYRWRDDTVKNSVTTDSAGRFHFPSATAKSIAASLLPHEPNVIQYLRISYQGQQYQGWFHGKRNYDNNGELQGRQLLLDCELQGEERPHPDIKSFGICVQANPS